MFSVDIYYSKLKHLICQIFSISKKAQLQSKAKQQKRDLILVLEDDEAFQKAAKKALQKLPYRVAIFSNGKEGIEYVRKHHGEVAFILLDIMMPIMDGIEFLTIVKRDSVLKKIPIILQTAMSKESIQGCIDMGADLYIQKPYTEVMICEAIKRLKI